MHCASRGGCAIRRIFVITRCLNSRCIVIRVGCKILYIYFVVELGLFKLIKIIAQINSQHIPNIEYRTFSLAIKMKRKG
jgi:hypothetical protein